MSDVDVLMSYVLGMSAMFAYVCRMGQAERGCNPTQPLPHCEFKIQVQRWIIRQAYYEDHVLEGYNTSIAIVRTMAMLDGLLSDKLLYVSTSDILRATNYRYWGRSYKALHDAFSRMQIRGYVIRAYRDKVVGIGSVTMWGLSGKGRQLLSEYYAYLSGERDGEIFS